MKEGMNTGVKRNNSMRLALVLLLLLVAPLVLAANDPGHDTLYVLISGDSNITGSVNLTGNVTASAIRYARILYGDQLDIRANNTVMPGPLSRPALQATSTEVYLDASTLNIKTITSGGTVQVGDKSLNNVIFNVSGTITQQNVNVCLQNGSNCPSTLGGSNVSGSGSIGYLAKWTSSGVIGNSVIYDDGTNVGVGTSSPNRKLEIYDTNYRLIRLNSSSTVGSFMEFQPTATGGVAWEIGATAGGASQGGGNFVFVDGAGDTILTMNSTTNYVGIGTTAPIAKLHVQDTGDVGLRIQGSTRSRLNLIGSPGWQIETPNGTGNSPNGTFGIVESGVANRFTIQNGTGNVGIGTTNPGSKLEVSGTAGANNPQISVNAPVSGTPAIFLYGAAGGVQPIIGYNSDGALRIMTITDAAGGGGSEKVRIDSSGNVGIGTTNPTQKLDVNGSLNVSGTSAKVYTPEICLAGNCQTTWPGGGGGNITGSGSANYVTKWQNATNLGNSVMQDDGTNVGIGATPNQKLTVSGNANVSGTVYAAAFSSNSPLQLQTGGTTRIYVNDTNGNVGIGTNTPQAKLWVEGNDIVLNTENSAQAKTLYFRYSDGATIQSDSYLAFGTSGSPTERMRIDSAGNVGIGTTAPTALLTVNGAYGSNGQLYVNGSTHGYVVVNGIAANEAGFRIDSAGTAKWWVYRPPNSHDLRFYDGSGTPGDRVTIQNTTGNVGIGTTSPAYKLSVVGTGAASNIFYVDDGGYKAIDVAAGSTTFLPYPTTGSTFTIKSWDSGWSQREVIKITSASAATSPHLVLQPSGGNVGIGTASPRGKLDIAASNAEGSIWGVDQIIGYNDLRFSADNAGTSTIMLLSPGGDSWINHGGDFGIGTTDPGNKLHVVGGGISLGDSTALTSRGLLNIHDTTNPRLSITKANVNGFRLETAGTAGVGNNRLNIGLDTSTGDTDVYMSVTNSGNVGIGTTGPNEKLVVNGGIGLSGYNWNVTTTADTNWGFRVSNPVAGYYYTDVTGAWAQNTGGAFRVMNKNGATETEYMRVNAGGNVGIGTADPRAKLQVEGDIIGSNLAGANLLQSSTNFADTAAWGSVNYVTTTFTDGSQIRALESTSTGNGAGCYEWASYQKLFKVDPAKKYEFSVWHRQTVGTSGSKYFGFHVYDSSGTIISGAWANPYFYATGAAPTSWTRVNAYLDPSYVTDANADGYSDIQSSKTHATDWRMPSNAAYAMVRMGYCYSGTASDKVQFAMPEVREVSPQDNDYGTMYVDSANNRVGIGTASPQYTLDVNGNARINNWYLYGSDPGNVPALWSNGAAMYLQSVTGDWVTAGYTRGNGLLVGGGGGSGNLHVYGTSALDGAVTFGAADRSLESSTSGGVSFYANEINAGAQGGTGTLYLGYRRTTNTIIQGQSGNVGIGTTSPVAGSRVNIVTGSNAGLVVADAAAVGGDCETYNTCMRLTGATHTQIKLEGRASSGGLRMFFDSTVDPPAGIHTTSAHKLGFGTNGARGQLVVDTDGDVGIGTTTPGSKLHIYNGGTGWSESQLHFSSGWTTTGTHATIGSGYSGIGAAGIMLGTPHVPWRSAFGAKIRFASDQAATTYWDWGMSEEAGGATDRFDLRRANTQLLSVDSAGKVGIGKPAPLAKLDTFGEIRASNPSSTGGDYDNYYIKMGANYDYANPGYIADVWGNIIETHNNDKVTINRNVGIGDTTPTNKLDVAGAIGISDTTIIDASRNIVNAGTGSFSGTLTAAQLSSTGAITAQGGVHVTHMPWTNVGGPPTGYVKLVTPIVHDESNMFTIFIEGYSYSTGRSITIHCSGYAYSASTLISSNCNTEGTSMPVEIGVENRGGTNLVVIRLGTPSSTWYYEHFTATYAGWQVKSASGFSWVFGETTPTQTGNTNNVFINDVAGTGSFAGDLTFTNYGTGVVGTYSDVRYQNVFSMGALYTPADDGTTLSNMYGIAWTHSNIGGQSKAGLGHQALFVAAGGTQTAIGNGIWTSGAVNVSTAGHTLSNDANNDLLIDAGSGGDVIIRIG